MLRLHCGGDSLVVAPAHGGSILGWTRDGRHVLRPPSPEAVLLGRPGAMGCFPLVPYCNRIAHRRFVWDGRTHDLAANFGDHPHAIHGVGWQRAWTVEAVARDRVTLALNHDPDKDDSARAWPFAFSALLTYALTAAGLTIEIAATNTGVAAAPMGIGAHPYFPHPGAGRFVSEGDFPGNPPPGDGDRGSAFPADTAPPGESHPVGENTITFIAEGVWLNQDALPVRHITVPTTWDHAAGRAVNAPPLDNCFTAWRGEARLPGLRLSADPVFGALQVFTPAGADFFCVEPVSHVPDALNLTGLSGAQAINVVPPGETLRGAMRFAPDTGMGS